MKKAVILLGSSNSEGETYQLVKYVQEQTGIPIIDLKEKNIQPFDYEFKNQGDDFLDLITQITEDYELIIFATPVYWYSMSGILKTFIDRFSDCLKIHKPIGRKLRGMEMAVISCGYDQELKPGFFMPFRETANYLSMPYVGEVHGWLREEAMTEKVKSALDNFVKIIT